MINPFEESQQSSFDQFDTSLPICFADKDMQFKQETRVSSPIGIIDLDILSEKLTSSEALEPKQLRENIKHLQTSLKEVKIYTERLENRNLELVIELEKQKMKNQQLVNALTFIKSEEESNWKSLEDKINTNRDLENRLSVEMIKNQQSEAQILGLRSEINYLKDLILIANENYQKLDAKFHETLEKNGNLLIQKDHREAQMIKKVQQIKNIFTKIVIDKNGSTEAQAQSHQLKDRKQLTNTINTANYSSNKTGKKQFVEDAYRQMFLKTLKSRKQNWNTKNVQGK